MLGETLKKALSDARIPHQEAADRMGISKTNLYNLFRKDTFEVEYLRKASEITGKPISDFFGVEFTIVNHENGLTSHNNGREITKVTKGVDDIKNLLAEELKEKNRQIAVLEQMLVGSQRMLESVLGKSEGAIDQPLSTDPMDQVMHLYRKTVFHQVLPLAAAASLT